MLGPLLTAKLFIPPPRRRFVPRPRLLDQLNRGLHRKLTLISAPAGFGKTTLAAAWIAACDRPAAWLTPDEGDSDPTRFLTYLVAALQTIAVDFGRELLNVLQSGSGPPGEAILTLLLNEIAAIPDDFVLVLDDYHLIDAQVVDEMLAFLLEHLPPQMHLLLTTREDPNLPLARYRVGGQLNELRVADLRFSPAEAAEFLNRAMDLDLTVEEIAALESRTEGWIAGLQMAALSLQGRAETTEFIQAFTGSHHFVMDYLVEEVLQRQPPDVRDFLLQTSILKRLSGPLCTAVTDQENSQGVLERLDRGDLLIVPLDERRHWYRYHHLFADVLQARALLEQPERMPVLHRRASIWYEESGSAADAIRHALAAHDFERAANLVERAWPEMNQHFQEGAWLRWANELPPEVIGARPVLCLNYAWALLNRGQLEASEAHLQTVERWVAAEETAVPIIADEGQYKTLPASLAAARSFQAQARGDVSATVQHGRRALELYTPENHLARGVAAAILGLAYLTNGELEEAHTTLAGGMVDMQAAGNILFALRGTYILADIRLAQGRLREAIRTYEQYLQLAAQHGESALRGTADLHLRLSELYIEQGNEHAAAEQLRRGAELGGKGATPVWRYRLHLAQARSKMAQGDLDGALAQLDAAERCYVRTPVPDLHPIPALKARVWIAQGRLDEARAWAIREGLSVEDDLSYVREFEHITLARLLEAQAFHDRASDFLQRLLGAAEEGGRMGSALEILLLQALAFQAQDDMPRALAALDGALALGAPQGYVRLFVDEGTPMARLLSSTLDRGLQPDYTRMLLAAFEPVPPTPPGPQPLIEPLSLRELEIMGLIAQGLSNRQISERLFLALSTVKGHNGRIFAKLAAQNRTEAVARARELGLL